MHIETYRGDRASLRHLFALADDSQTQIAAYIELGDVLVARDSDAILGHLQFLETGEAGVFELKDALGGDISVGETLVGTVVSFVVAYAAIAWLLRFVAHHSIAWFVPYRVALGLLLLALLSTSAMSAT